VSIATTTAIALGVTAAATAAGAAISAHGAESAAHTQANAEYSAEDLQQQEWQQQQANEAPFLAAGQSALPQLQADVNNPAFSEYPGGTFTGPTAAQAEQYPGEQFQLQQGAQAIDENAAATGNLLSGTTGEALENFGQGLAQTDYGNVYNQALQQYMTNYGVWNQDTTNQVNRLQALANTGSSAAANLGQQGEAAAQTEGSEAVGAGTALASGTVGASNAITGSLNNLTSTLPLYSLLNLQQQQANSSSYAQAGNNSFWNPDWGANPSAPVSNNPSAPVSNNPFASDYGLGNS
jgi:hypothetical protein